MIDSHVQFPSVKFQVRHPMVENCNNLIAGNIFIMELTEEYSVSLYNEALSGVRVYLYQPFYSRERENAKLSGTKLSENREINKLETRRQVNI